MNNVRVRSIDIKTLAVGALCLCGAGAGGWLLYQDMNSSGRSGTGPALVKVERRESKVRRKAAGSYVWSNVRVAEDLFRKDAVQTGVDSAATLRFSDGSFLDMNENSLVIVDDIRDLSLNFLQGSFVVRRESGESQVTVSRGGKPKVEEFPVRLLKPESFANYVSPQGAARRIEFSWKSAAAHPGGGGVLLQISHDGDFVPSRTSTTEFRAEGAGNWSGDLKRGHYFWRIAESVPEIGIKGVSRISQFDIREAVAVRPVWPGGGEKIAIFPGNAGVQFRWVPPADSAGSSAEHRIEIARDPSFREIAVTQVLNLMTGSATISGVPTGALYWRVSSRYDELRVAGVAENFVIESAKNVGVRLVSPADNVPVEDQRQMRFNWECDSDLADFLVEMTNIRGEIVHSQRIRGTSAIWKDAPVGQYRWRVVAYQQGQKAGESTWRGVSIFKSPIVLQSPVNEQRILYWDHPAVFSFRWQPEPAESAAEDAGFRYRLEVAPDPEFRVGTISWVGREREVRGNGLNLQQGLLYWRVSLLDTGNQPLKSSPVRKFTYGTYPTLVSPQQVSPEIGKVFNLRDQPEEPGVAWSEVPEAEAYEVAVIRAVVDVRAPASVTDDASVVRKRTKDRRLSLKGLPPGTYYWTVRSIDRLKRPGQQSAPQKFTISFGAPVSAPKIINPGVQ